MVQFNTQWAYSFSENRFLSPSCSSCQITFMPSSTSASLGSLCSWVRLRQSSGRWLSLEIPRASPQFLTQWDHGTQFKKPALGYDFFSNPLGGWGEHCFFKWQLLTIREASNFWSSGRLQGWGKDTRSSGRYCNEVFVCLWNMQR